MKPNKPRIKEWIAALRSGKYPQGKHCLKTAEGNYCCLGVASDISNLGTWDKEHCQESYFYTSKTNLDNTGNGFLIKDVMEYYGLNQANPKIKSSGLNLTSINDTGHNFEEIADILETEYINTRK